MSTKGFVIRLRTPWDEIGPHVIAAETAGRAKSICMSSARDMHYRDITYATIKSCVRFPPADGRKVGYCGHQEWPCLS